MSAPDSVLCPRADACPGVLRLTEAADGWLARIRLPGGFVDGHGLRALVRISKELGDSRLELTSRSNVQIRGLAADVGSDLSERLFAAGLFPSATHERVRNIVASPLAGLDRLGGLQSIVESLDERLCATPCLAELSGRFLFAVDDGRGDVSELGADVLIRDGMVNGLRVEDPVAAAIQLALAFLDERAAQDSTAWRVADLTDGIERVRARAAAALGIQLPSADDWSPAPSADRPVAGPFATVEGGVALVLAVPLGRLTQEQAAWLAGQVGSEPARITPWRSVVLPDVTAEVVAAAADRGFAVTPDSPWLDVSSCAGRPGCGKALADVQADARAGLDRWPERAVHWSGCERRCGRSARTEIDVVATHSGYRIEPVDA
jgi:precorrin-3B synthase